MALVVQHDATHVEHHVGRVVGVRVVHLVKQLLAHGVEVDAPTRAGCLGDQRRAVFRDLGDRVADVRQIGNRLPRALAAEVAAAALARTLQQMPHGEALGQAVQVLRFGGAAELPAQAVHQRPEEQRGVGHAAGDHDVGPGVQRLHDGRGAQVGVAEHQPLAHLRHRLTREQVGQFVGRRSVQQPWQHVVAAHHRHARAPALGRERGPHQRVVVLSNYVTPDIRTRCQALGADAVFDKSRDLDAFIEYCNADRPSGMAAL
ncbi:hypothetical protein D9M69_476090 [compost metagenome]